MAPSRTTICCSAFALTLIGSVLAGSVSSHAQEQRPRPFPLPMFKRAPHVTPRPFFPIRPLWTLALNNAVVAPPAFDATTMFVPIEGDRIAAYDVGPGTLRWLAPVGTTIEPATGDGLVFLIGSQSIIALQADTGIVAWNLPFAGRVGLPPIWNNGWLIVTTIDGGIFAFRASNGEPLWHRDVAAPAHARPAVSGDHLYVATDDGRVVALQVSSGEPLWEHRLGGAPSDILALEDRLFVGSRDNYFYCLNAGTGEEDWRWRTGADVIGLPMVDDERVYFVSLDNVLRSLNRSNGVQRWQRPLPLRPVTGPQLVGSTIIVAGVAPSLRGYNAQTGVAAGDLPTAGELAAPPHPFFDTAANRVDLLVVTRDIAKGATVTCVTTDFEPTMLKLAVLPNAISVPPTLGTPQAASPR